MHEVLVNLLGGLSLPRKSVVRKTDRPDMNLSPALLLVCVLFVLFLLFIVVLSGEPRQKQGRGLVDHKLVQAPQYFLSLAVPRRLFCFGSLVILDVARCYLWLFTLYINIKIGKNSC